MSRTYPTRDEIAARFEDVRWMADTGECLDGAARRLGMSREALERWLERNDRDVFATLLARQPRDHNRQVAGDPVWELTGLADRRRARTARRRTPREAAA